ncbi:MAG: hypothetical protein JWS12_309 [Candidatus Saccharibacteria bacterium]|nr:hypothetical protein [Candidatus Saccharibacteria bacterium]
MGKVGRAVAGVVASAVVAGGAYGVEILTNNAEQHAIEHCATKFEDPHAQKDCIDSTKNIYNKGEGLNLIELAGLVGVVGCGYLGYKAIKEENHTTGIIEDHL